MWSLASLALKTLVFERGKFVAAALGVAFSAMLVLCNAGLYLGFEQMATNVVARSGGDVWVMAKGTKLLDFADPLSSGVRERLAGHACVAGVRGLVMAWSTIVKPSGGVDNIQLIGVERATSFAMPWNLAEGLPADLESPRRVAVDVGDLERLEVPSPALGRALEIGGREVYVGALTENIRSFTVVPYVFASFTEAQAIANMGERSTFYLVDVTEPSCAADFIDWVDAQPDLQALRREAFEQMTARYWLLASGAGASLGFSAFLGLVVGLVVVGQTLFSLTESRLKELATFKTMGASSRELVSVVLLQAACLGLLGSVIGVLIAAGARYLVGLGRMTLVLSTSTLAVGLVAVTAMCGVAAVISMRRVLVVKPAEVFR